MQINIGINDQNRQQIADRLSRLLADSYMLYLKTHNFHWPGSYSQFTELAAVSEETGQPGATDMIRRLVNNQVPMPRAAREFN